MPPAATLNRPQFPLYVESNEPTIGVHKLPTGEAVVYSNRSPDKPTPNEDSAGVVDLGPRGAVLIVADGLGGLPDGEQASRTLVESIAASLLEYADETQPPRVGILDGIEHANEQLLLSGANAATTLAAVSIEGREVRPYHVGDSMILVVGQRGRVKLYTISHSPVGYAVEAGLLNQAEAMHHEDRHVVSNVVGSQEMRIEIGSRVTLAPRDTLLLASDGLFDNLHVEEIIEMIRKGPLEEAMHQLTTAAVDRMQHAREGLPSKPDDLTCILYRAA